MLPLQDTDFDANTETGTVKLGGGLTIDLPSANTQSKIENPALVIGATDDASGLYANVNGQRRRPGRDAAAVAERLVPRFLELPSLDRARRYLWPDGRLVQILWTP